MTDTEGTSSFMSATKCSSGRTQSKRPSSAPRAAGLRSSSPNLRRPSSPSARDKSDEINRKLDYLLKKTRSLEDALKSSRAENAKLVAENKKTQECTVNIWESIKMDRECVSCLRSDFSSLRAKMELVHQKTNLMGNNPTKSVHSEEIGIISEEVFARVHREFSSVVDEVVRTCVKEQVDFLNKWTAKGGLEKDTLLLEEHKSLQSEMEKMKKQHNALIISIQEKEMASLGFSESQQAALAKMTRESNGETQRILESLTKRMNDSIKFAISDFQEEISKKYDGTMHQVINSCNDLQVRIAESEDQMTDVQASIADNKEYIDVEIFNLSAVVENAKDAVQRLEVALEDVNHRKQRVSESSHSRVAQNVPGQDVMQAMEHQIDHQEENMNRYLHLLEDIRNDYTEAISKLSSAGRQAKADHQVLVDKVHGLDEALKYSDERIDTQREKDQAVLSKISNEIDKLSSDMANYRNDVGFKKKKKKGSEVEVFADSAHSDELRNLKERMDIFEESVIDTVQDMIDTQNEEALAPFEKRLKSVELHQEKYESVTKEGVDSFHSEDIISTASSVQKVEQLLEKMTSKLSQGPPTENVPSNFPERNISRNNLTSSSTQLSSNQQIPTRSQISLPSHPVSSSSPDRSSNSTEGFSGNLHSNTLREKKTLPMNSDVSHKPKYHPPQSVNLNTALSPAHEILPVTGIPNLSTLPDLRKSSREKKFQNSSHSDLDREFVVDAMTRSVKSDSFQSASHPLVNEAPTSGFQQSEAILKSLHDKKQKHRKKFQAQVRSELNLSE